MEQKEKISVIVPVYNAEAYLDECVKSIAAQTYDNLEIILVNDNSKDKSREIMEQWAAKDNRVRLFDNHGKKHGAAVARNIGLDNATGDMIAFCDNDDTMKPQMLMRLYTLMNENNANVSFCSREVVSDWYVNKWKDTGVKIFERGGCSIDDLGTPYDFYCVWTKLYRRFIFDDLRMPEDIRFGDDLWVAPDVFEKAQRVVYTSERLYNYSLRKDNDSFTMGTNDDIIWGLARTHRKFFEYCVRHKAYTNISQLQSVRIYFALAISNGSSQLRRKAIPEWRSIYKKYRDILSKDKKSKLMYYFPHLVAVIKKLRNHIKR